jgi:hypothetical protein
MAKQRNVGREILLSLTAAAIFGGAFYVYLDSSMPKPSDPAHSPLLASSAAQGPDDLQLASAVTSRFIAELHTGHPEAAYALMASAYRERFSAQKFRAQCGASPFLASADRAVLSRTRRVVPPGGAAQSTSLHGLGLLASGTHSIEADFTLLPDADAELRIVVLSIAGVVVLDGVSGRR